MTVIPYNPPERMFQDAILAFKDMKMASTWSARVEPDPYGPVNKIVSLWRGNHRVKAVLWPVPAGAEVKFSTAIVPVGPVKIQWPGNLWSSAWPGAADGWYVEIDGWPVLTVPEHETYPPTPPPLKVPLWQRIRPALRRRTRAGVDAVAGKLGYHREYEEDW